MILSADMWNVIFLLCLSFFLDGCSFLPGMENPDTTILHIEKPPETFVVQPVIIPISAALLINDPPPRYIYQVSPQDVLSIVVWQHPEFNPPIQQLAVGATDSSQAAGSPGYLVNYDGTIYFPLVGYIHVAGKTMTQIRNALTVRLKKYIKNPQVIVRVADYRSKKVYVFGEVNNPILLPLNDQPMSITDAILLAGSFNLLTSDPRHVYVIRGDFICPRIYWLNAKTPDVLLLAESFQLQPGDILYVSAAVVTNWNRFLNQVLPTLQTIWFTKTITRK